jgi:hypothetical protein
MRPRKWDDRPTCCEWYARPGGSPRAAIEVGHARYLHCLAARHDSGSEFFVTCRLQDSCFVTAPPWAALVGRSHQCQPPHPHTQLPSGHSTTKSSRIFCYRKLTPQDASQHALAAWLDHSDTALPVARVLDGVLVDPRAPHRGHRYSDQHAPSQPRTTASAAECPMPVALQQREAIDTRRHRACASGHEPGQVSGPAQGVATGGGEPREGAMAELDEGSGNGQTRRLRCRRPDDDEAPGILTVAEVVTGC